MYKVKTNLSGWVSWLDWYKRGGCGLIMLHVRNGNLLLLKFGDKTEKL